MAGKASLKMWIGAASNFSLIPSCSICQSCWQLKLFGNSIRLYLNTERVILSIYYYSNEKVPFCVVPVRAEAFLVFNRGVLNRHLADTFRQAANSRPTVGWQTANGQPTVGRKFSQKAVNDSRPTVDQQSTDSWPTVFWVSCSSLFPIFSCSHPHKTWN